MKPTACAHVVATTAVVGALVAACGADRPTASVPPRSEASPGLVVYPVAQRESAPSLTGTTLSGRRFALSSAVGKGVVAVNVWASWCPPCRKEMPLLARADGRLLTVVGVDEQDRSADARSVAASLGVRYPILADPDGTMLHSLRVLPQVGVPSTVFLDDHGRIAGRVIGPVDDHALRVVLSRMGASS